MNLTRLYTIILLFSFAFTTPAIAAKVFCDSDNRVTLTLDNDEVAIFGYGSLMLREQLHPTTNADDNIYSGPFIKAQLSGFKRSWSTSSSSLHDNDDEDYIILNTIYLNIEPASNSKVNGIIFVCLKSELTSYDRRESSYNRINITDKLNISVLGGNVFAYTAKPTHFFPTENATKDEAVIWQYYVDIIDEALTTLGDEFREDYYNSSQPLPTHLVVE